MATIATLRDFSLLLGITKALRDDPLTKGARGLMSAKLVLTKLKIEPYCLSCPVSVTVLKRHEKLATAKIVLLEFYAPPYGKCHGCLT